jgi:hypothetical protein
MRVIDLPRKREQINIMVICGVLWGMVILAECPSSLMWSSAALLITSINLVSENKPGENMSHFAEE